MLASIFVSAIPVIFGPGLLISAAQNVVQVSISLKAGSVMVMATPYSVTSIAVPYNSSQLMLILSGDVETNPGPPTGKKHFY